MRKKERVEKILDVDASMQGNMVFKDPVNLRINGTFEGGLDTKGNLTIGENAVVKADIRGEAIKIAGTVIGDIMASKGLNIIPPGKVTGDIKTPVIAISEGAVFEGKVQMQKTGQPPKPASSKNTLSIDEVARYLEVDKSLILNWASEGKLPGVKDNNTWTFERAALDDWIANEKIR
jgi:excisionase family DNA binding protein